jgi:type IV pilus assembly protein PilM
MALLGKSGGPTLGLDIGTSMVKAVEVRPGKNGPVVTAIGIMPTPPGIFAGDVISDPKALGASIKKLLRDSGITVKNVVSAVSGQTSFVLRPIEVPKMTEKELKETMRFEVDRHIPFPASEVVMDYAPLVRGDEPPDAQNMTVLLAVGQQQMVRAHLETILYAGLNPVAIDVEPLAAARALLVDGYSELTVALINIGAVKTDISIFERGLLVLPRTVFVAGDNFTRAVSDATGQPMEQAERLKRLYAEIPPSRTGVPEEGAAAESVGAFDLGGLEQEIEEGVYGVEDEEVAPAPTVRFSLDDVDTGGGDLGFDFDIGKRAEEEPSPSEPAKPSEAETHPVAPVDSESELKKKVVDAVLPVFSELVMELRRSFDYYQGRNPDARIDRVILCGGTAMMKGLSGALEEELGIPVEVADLSKRYGLMSKSLSAGYYSEVAPVLPVGIGLAVRDMVETNGASRGRRQR